MDSRKIALDAINKILDNPKTFDSLIDKLFSIIDKDNSGGLDLGEMEEFMITSANSMGMSAPPSKENIKAMFDKLDINKDKVLSKEELAIFVRSMLEDQRKRLSA